MLTISNFYERLFYFLEVPLLDCKKMRKRKHAYIKRQNVFVRHTVLLTDRVRESGNAIASVRPFFSIILYLLHSPTDL